MNGQKKEPVSNCSGEKEGTLLNGSDSAPQSDQMFDFKHLIKLFQKNETETVKIVEDSIKFHNQK